MDTRKIIDYHIHSDFSMDAHSTMDSICREAINRGIYEICFTEHVDFVPWDNGCGYFKPDEYLACLNKNKDVFQDHLSIKAGIEISEPDMVIQQVDLLLEKRDFDFVLGSVHLMDKSRLTLPEVYNIYQPEIVERAYFERVLEVAEKGNFDCLAHFDLVRRYRPLTLQPFNPFDYENIIREIIKILVDRDKGLEINTSPIRRGKNDTCPDLTILRWYRESGGEIITTGSDAHSREEIAADFDIALELAVKAGYKAITRFEKRKKIMEPI